MTRRRTSCETTTESNSSPVQDPQHRHIEVGAVSPLNDVLGEEGVSFTLVSGGQEALMECPFCSSGSAPKLYVNVNTGRWTCFRCEDRGGLRSFLERVLDLDPIKASHLAKKLGQQNIVRRVREDQEQPEEITLPKGYHPLTGNGSLERRFWRYLERRRFDEGLVKRYHIGYATTGFYAWRIIIPIFTKKRLRNFVARSLLDACPRCTEAECRCPDAWKKVRNPKGGKPSFSLFNYDKVYAAGNKQVVLVEGVFDALRVPDLAVASLGTNISRYQRNLLRSFESVTVLWDGDEAGKHAALKVSQQLIAALIPTKLAFLPAGYDPADASRDLIMHQVTSAIPANLYVSSTLARRELDVNQQNR